MSWIFLSAFYSWCLCCVHVKSILQIHSCSLSSPVSVYPASPLCVKPPVIALPPKARSFSIKINIYTELNLLRLCSLYEVVIYANVFCKACTCALFSLIFSYIIFLKYLNILKTNYTVLTLWLNRKKCHWSKCYCKQTVEMVLVQLPRWPGIWPRVNTVELLRGPIVRKSVNKPYLCFLCCSILVSSSLQTSATPADTWSWTW